MEYSANERICCVEMRKIYLKTGCHPSRAEMRKIYLKIGCHPSRILNPLGSMYGMLVQPCSIA